MEMRRLRLIFGALFALQASLFFAGGAIAYSSSPVPSASLPYFAEAPTQHQADVRVANSFGGSSSGPIISTPTIPAWGDSLTAGNEDGSGVTYPNVLAGLYYPKRVVSNQGVGGETSTQILARFMAAPTSWVFPSVAWMGRNDLSSPATVIANVSTLTGHLSRYLVLSVINGQGEPSGSGNYNNIATINSSLAGYGTSYLDVRSKLVAAYNPANPIDVLNQAADMPPFTLHAVNSHGTLNGTIDASTCNISLTPGANNLSSVGVNVILTIGSEYIYVTAVANSTTVSGCTRGYAGTTAAGHATGTAYDGTDSVHLNAAGYTLIAQWVYQAIQSLGGWAHLLDRDLNPAANDNVPMRSSRTG